ncbi:TfoX/Sxy family protein [Georgenia sp. Z1491]|uniref:TfoX/Sxy family protein n=1 Tax=Georgenia sp. Z1491 TaxID=3416707 RepID=UPI003CF9AB33
MTAERDRLVERLRVLLAGEPSTLEKRMFGGVAFMVREQMVVSASGDGSLLVRVDRAADPGLVDLAGASRAEMGEGRSMGPGWIRVDASAIDDEDGLSRWIGRAMERNRSVTGV